MVMVRKLHKARFVRGIMKKANVVAPDPHQYGYGVDLGLVRCFPDDSPWNQDISAVPVDPGSDLMIATLGNPSLKGDYGTYYAGARNGIPYFVVPADQPMVPIILGDYANESDPGPYPIPPNAIPEGWGIQPEGEYTDGHVIVVQRDSSKFNGLGKLYELFRGNPVGDYPTNVTGWTCQSGAIFELYSNVLRPDGWTSGDAAGLPIFPGLVRYEETERAIADYAAGGPGVIPHALRFTIAAGYTRQAWINPARHQAAYGTGAHLMPFGARVRLKASTNLDGFPPYIAAVLRTLKVYGMYQADNGGNFWISGAPDDRWSNDLIAYFGYIHANDFEVIQMGPITTPP